MAAARKLRVVPQSPLSLVTHEKSEPQLAANFWPPFLFISTIMLGLVTYQIWDSYNKTIQAAQAQATNSTSVIEQALSVILKSVQISLEHLKHELEHDPQKMLLTSQTLKTHKTTLSHITSIELRAANDKGQIIGSTANSPVNVAEKEYFQYLKNNRTDELHISEPFYGEVQKKWLFTLARRLENPRTGSFRGVIIASIELNFFDTYPQLLQLNESNLFAITMGKNLRFAYRYPKESDSVIGKPAQFNKALTPLIRKEYHQLNSMERSHVDGKRRILSATWIGAYPIVVLIGTQYDKVIRPWLLQSITLSIIALCLFLFGIFVVRRFSEYNQTILNQQGQLIHSAKLTTLGEMSANIAHEINNPLTIVSAHIEKIEYLGTQGKLSKEQLQKSVTTINNTLKRIDRIIKGLRNFSRSSPEQIEPVALKNIFDDTLGICSERYRGAGVKLEIPSTGLEIKVRADQVQITQVLVNLLVNSLEAISDSPDKWVKVQLHCNQGFAHIAVIDSGNGIPAEHQQKLMEPFFTTKAVGKGTGLGLSISKNIIESFGGKFWYDKGATNTKFIVEIPLA